MKKLQLKAQRAPLDSDKAAGTSLSVAVYLVPTYNLPNRHKP